MLPLTLERLKGETGTWGGDEGIFRRLGSHPEPAHYIHMKRTTLMLDEQLLKEARRLGEERTYSATVNRALADFVRRIRAVGGRPARDARRSSPWFSRRI